MSIYDRDSISKRLLGGIVDIINGPANGEGALHLDERITFSDVRLLFKRLDEHYADHFRILDVDSAHVEDNQGVAIAKLVKHSSTVKSVLLRHNHFSEVTVDAMAHALVVNTSVTNLLMTPDNCQSVRSIKNALIFALRFGPERPPESIWMVIPNPYRSLGDDESARENIYPLLKRDADKLGHPSMLSLLVIQHEPMAARRRFH